MARYEYAQVDVFTNQPLQGNGLAVVFCDRFPVEGVMLDLAREFKQFETIFVQEPQGGKTKARIYTMEGELPFAGHPLLGAAAALHERMHGEEARFSTVFQLAEKDVPVTSTKTKTGFHAQMAQGKPAYMGQLSEEDSAWMLSAHNLSEDRLAVGLPVEVVSTGLPYVLLPIRGGVENVRIVAPDLEARLQQVGARYSYVFDVDTLEARTWDNAGLIEDTATGSAAGPVCAYLFRHGRAVEGELLTIHQGQYANRPGTLYATMQNGEIYVSGDVTPFAKGQFTLP